MKYLGLTIFFFFTWSLYSQDNFDALQQDEEELALLLTEIRESKETEVLDEKNELFKKKLEKALEKEGGFDYPFQALQSMGKIYSQDRLVRIISWNIQYKDGQQNYFSYVLKKNERNKKVTVTELKQSKDQRLQMLVHDPVTPENWYGGLYYEIIDVQKGRRTYYTLLGYGSNNLRSNIKFIDVLFFRGTMPNFGMPLFKTKDNRNHRMIFEYSNEATMSLKYDPARRKIIFDHLSPEAPNMKEFREYYVPDMSYDAFEWNGKQWVLEEDIVAVNPEKGNVVNLKAYDKDLDSVITIPKEGEWINPQNLDAPIDGGAHKAVTPDDIKEEKRGKKKAKKKSKEPDYDGLQYNNLNQKDIKKNRRKQQKRSKKN